MVELTVIVESPDKLHVGKFKQLFRRTLSYDDNLVVPFSKIYEGLKVLFPQPDIYITFRI